MFTESFPCFLHCNNIKDQTAKPVFLLKQIALQFRSRGLAARDGCIFPAAGSWKHLALPVLKEINLCWQHPVGVKCWNPVLNSNLKYQKCLFFICTWQKFLYKEIQGVRKLCGSRGVTSHTESYMACIHASASTALTLALLHLELINSIRKV